MRSKEVDLAIKNFENYDKLISIYRPKDVTIENPQDFNKDVETVLNYISELEKETDELKIEKNNLINERDKLIEEYNKTGEFASNQNRSFKRIIGNRIDKYKQKRYKKIIQYDLNENFIKEWDSISEISKELKISSSGIIACAK